LQEPERLLELRGEREVLPQPQLHGLTHPILLSPRVVTKERCARRSVN
jgi:hypothetical protein